MIQPLADFTSKYSKRKVRAIVFNSNSNVSVCLIHSWEVTLSVPLSVPLSVTLSITLSVTLSVQEVVTLSLGAVREEGTPQLRIFDPIVVAQKSQIDLPESSEYVCLSQNVDRRLYAVGSKALITLVDPRTSSVVRKIPTHCSHQNIRSISFSDNVCSIGTGSGSLLFYDLKKDDFFAEKISGDEPCSRKRTSFLSCSEGYTVCGSLLVFLCLCLCLYH